MQADLKKFKTKKMAPKTLRMRSDMDKIFSAPDLKKLTSLRRQMEIMREEKKNEEEKIKEEKIRLDRENSEREIGVLKIKIIIFNDCKTLNFAYF